MESSMSLVLDPDVQRIAEFMQREIAADRIIAVANGLAAVAPLLWAPERSVLTLRAPPIS